MGLGDSLLGETLLGEDEIARGVADGSLTPRALRFNAKTRDFDRDENGRYIDAHPVDADVALALFIEAQKLGSTPEVGQTLRRIRNPVGASVGTDVKNRVRIALKHLVDRGDIEVISVTHEAKNRHTLFVEVEYVNLRLQAPNNRTKLSLAL